MLVFFKDRSGSGKKGNSRLLQVAHGCKLYAFFPSDQLGRKRN